MAYKEKLKRANRILFSIIGFILLFVIFEVVNPKISTGKTIKGTAIQVVQMQSKGYYAYYRVVIELANGALITKEMPLNARMKVGQTVNLQVLKRKYIGGVSYQ